MYQFPMIVITRSDVSWFGLDKISLSVFSHTEKSYLNLGNLIQI